MTPVQIEISTSLKSLPCFQWQRGMKDDQDRHVVGTAPEERRVCVCCTDSGSVYWIPAGDMGAPDLNDTATLGCLYDLACEKWKAAQITVTGAATIWWNALGGGFYGPSSEINKAPIPDEIHDAFPDKYIAAAVCAALLYEVTK